MQSPARPAYLPWVDLTRIIAIFFVVVVHVSYQLMFKWGQIPFGWWMMGNVVAHMDKKDNIYPNKERAENKIDGVIGLIMATDQMARDRSEEPGIIIL